jgi:hypothetical protein
MIFPKRSYAYLILTRPYEIICSTISSQNSTGNFNCEVARLQKSCRIRAHQFTEKNRLVFGLLMSYFFKMVGNDKSFPQNRSTYKRSDCQALIVSWPQNLHKRPISIQRHPPGFECLSTKYEAQGFCYPVITLTRRRTAAESSIHSNQLSPAPAAGQDINRLTVKIGHPGVIEAPWALLRIADQHCGRAVDGPPQVDLPGAGSVSKSVANRLA